MNDRFFLDTNVLVYSFDASAPEKKQTAIELIRAALTSGRGVISTQVIGEFVNVALTKFKSPMSPAHCKEYLNRFLLPLCDTQTDSRLILDAIDIREETGYGFYDCLILAAAVRCRAGILYSEDLQSGRIVRGVRIVNPFAAV